MTRTTCSVLLLASLVASQAEAVPYQLAHTFRDPEPAAEDYFGTAIAIEDGVVAIKSRSGSQDGDGLSRTHVFEANAAGGWDEAASFDFLSSPDNDGNPFIGEELAIDGGTIAVGFGPYFNSGTSSNPVQVLSRDASGWSRRFATLAEIRRPINGPQEFAGRGQRPAGRSVGISGDFIIAEESGAPRPDLSGLGVARIFERQTDGSWLESANLFSTSDEQAGAATVAIDGDTAVLVYRAGITPDSRAGVFFYERQSGGDWAATQEFLEASNADSFYMPVIDLDGDAAAGRDLFTGEITTYRRIGGVWQETLGPPAPAGEYAFDKSGFAFEGDLLARTVGGVLEDEPPVVEVFRRDEADDWGLLTTIENPLPDAGLEFGWKLAFDEGRLLVGARSPASQVGGPPTTPGAAFLFVPVPEPSAAVLVVAALSALVSRRR